MAILRSLILRRTTLPLLLRRRSLSSAASANSRSSPPWNRNPVRKMSSSSKPKRGDTDGLYEDFSFNQIDVLDDYKFAYEDFKPRDLGITEIEGCDLNHWLITIDFPEDPKPYPEDMIRFYEKTVSKALNLSLEEAKKKIYACSTSNYTGFHVEVSEKESEKFKGKHGVVFILPDSYVDREKKEYGGDKYINGIIIPRPRRTLDGKTRETPRKYKAPLPDWLGSSSRTREPGARENQQRAFDAEDRGVFSCQEERNCEGQPSYHEPPISAPYHHQNYHQESPPPPPPPPPSYLMGSGVTKTYGLVGPGYHGPAQQGPGYSHTPEPGHYTPYEPGPGNYQPRWQGQQQHLDPPGQDYPYPERPVQGQGYDTVDNYPNPFAQPAPNSGYQGFPMWYWSGPNF